MIAAKPATGRILYQDPVRLFCKLVLASKIEFNCNQCKLRLEKQCPKQGMYFRIFFVLNRVRVSNPQRLTYTQMLVEPVQYRKWSPTANDPETANDPQNGPQMILDRKWSLKSTANDPVKSWGMEWILWDWLQKRTDYKKETFLSRLLKKKGRRTLHLRSIYTRRKKKKWNKSEKVWY